MLHPAGGHLVQVGSTTHSLTAQTGQVDYLPLGQQRLVPVKWTSPLAVRPVWSVYTALLHSSDCSQANLSRML